MFRKLLILLLFCQTIFAGVNLEVPIEMIDYGLSSSSSSAIVFDRAQIYLDSDDYDEATYYFEIVASNGNASYDYDVDLYDVTGSAVKATITIPKSSSTTRFRSTSWSPADNTTRVYAVQTPQTASYNNVRIHTARVIVVQQNATKTRIQIPLLSGDYATYSYSQDKYLAIANQTSYPAGVGSLIYSTYSKNTAVLADISGWSLEGLMRVGNAAKTAYAALWNVTDDVQVADSEVAHTGDTDITLVSVDFADNATNFDNADNFEVKFRIGADQAGNVFFYRFDLYVRLTNLSKAEIVWCVGKRLDTGGESGNGIDYHQRCLINTSAYSSPACYFESCGYNATDEDTVYLRDHLTNDLGYNGSDVENSGINYNSAAKIRTRTSALTLTDGDRFYMRWATPAGTLYQVSAWIVIDCESAAPPAAPAGGQVIIINEDW